MYGSVFCLFLGILVVGCVAGTPRPQEKAVFNMSQEGVAEWSAIIDSKDPAQAEEWLRKYPRSSYRPTVEQYLANIKSERRVYEPYAKRDTVEGYGEFLDKYPRSYLAEEAKKRIVEKITREESLAFCSSVPKGKQIATRKFLIKVNGIFSSMRDYHLSTVGSSTGGGILRKDIDRYTDVIAEAVGEVPDEAISYVEETYRLLRESFSPPMDQEYLYRWAAKESIINRLSQTSDWDSICVSR